MPKADPGRLARLITTRDQLAQALADGPSGRDLPNMSREYRQVLREISVIEAVKEEPDAVDEITARRAAKGSRRAAR
jgi:hypothetical protein